MSSQNNVKCDVGFCCKQPQKKTTINPFTKQGIYLTIGISVNFGHIQLLMECVKSAHEALLLHGYRVPLCLLLINVAHGDYMFGVVVYGYVCAVLCIESRTIHPSIFE